jgi:ankyrin repeat protein
MNKSDLVEKMLEADKYLVYEYDPSFMTALHWSCVRNCRAVALLLLRYGADPDAQDMIGRTPLFLALLHTNNDIA